MNAVQAAERAGVRPSTVTRWVQSGKLVAGRLPSGQLQIEEEALDEFLESRAVVPQPVSRSVDALALHTGKIRYKDRGG